VDTSVVIELDRIPTSELPKEMAMAAVTMTEMAVGPHATTDAKLMSHQRHRDA
jgi:hypothetical protein